MRRLLIKLSAIGLIFVVCIALLEGLCTLASWWQYGTVNVERLNELDAGNVFATEMHHASFAETVKPHPWLGIVPRPLPGVSVRWRKNEIGTFPIERDSSKFTVLLTGGSCAQLLGVSGDGNGPSFLEVALSKQLGRDVRVLNAGQGSTAQPRPAITAMIYGDVVDAVICLDGFNESCSMDGTQLRLDSPSNWFADMNPMAGGSYDRIGASWQANALKRYSLDHNSRAVFYVTKVLRRHLETSAPKNDVRLEFALPQEWNSIRREDYNLAQYCKYVRLSHAVCDEQGLKYAHFIQPCPAIGKVLTDEEIRAVGELGYADDYRKMIAALLTLNDAGIDVVSLEDCFAAVRETVYVDRVHCAVDGEAYRLMSNRIADELARLWKAPTTRESQ